MATETATDGGDDELFQADCGHMISRGEGVSIPEVTLCEECYTPAPVKKWPTVLNSNKSYAGQNYHGTAEYHTTKTILLGLDRRGRGVYWDQGESCLLYVVPMNDHAYQRDREQAREEWGRELRPLRKRHVGPEPDPGHPGSFHTLPNNDHLTVVEREPGPFRSHEYRELQNWLHENTDDWQMMYPDMVERFDLQGCFGMESGRPLVSKACGECGYVEEQVDPAKDTHCPECGSYKFNSRYYDEQEGEQ